MKQNTLVPAIVSGAVCFAIGLIGATLLTKPDKEETKATIAVVEANANEAQEIAQEKLQIAKAEITHLQNKLKRVTSELKQTKDKLAAEKETHTAKAEERDQNIVTKPVDEIKITSKPMFGIYLGEKLSEVQERFEMVKRGLIWVVQDTSTAVEDCHLNIHKDRVWALTVWLKDNTKSNFNALKQKLKKEYRKYQVREVKSSYDKPDNPSLPPTYVFEFKVTIDGIPVHVAITFIDNFTAYMAEPEDIRRDFPSLAKNELSIQFIHLALREGV